MKKTSLYAGIALAVAALASCSGDEQGLDWQSDPTAVRVNATVGGTTLTRSNPLGTEDEQTQFNKGDQIKVKADNQNYVTYEYDGSSTWASTPSTAYLKWAKEKMTFTAYYPADATDESNFTLPQDQSTADLLATADYMTFSGDITNDGKNNATFTLQRKMALVTITVKSFGDQFSSDAKITSLTIGSYDGIANGAATATTTYVTPYITTGEGAAGTTYAAIVVPGSGLDDFVKLTVTDGTETTELTVNNTVEMKEGNSYAYTLIVGKDKLEIGSVEVKAWTDETLTGGKMTYLGTKSASNAAVGDYFLSDGSLVGGSETLTSEQKAACIGIVFALASDAGTNDQSDYSSTGIGQAACHGYVIALKDACDANTALTSGADDCGTITNTSYVDKATDWSGYYNTQKLLAKYSTDTNTGIYYATAYTPAAPAGTSGWFVPSVRQMYTARVALKTDGNIVKTSLENAGGTINTGDSDRYWTSTGVPGTGNEGKTLLVKMYEFTNGLHLFALRTASSDGTVAKRYIRSVLAF